MVKMYSGPCSTCQQTRLKTMHMSHLVLSARKLLCFMVGNSDAKLAGSSLRYDLEIVLCRFRVIEGDRQIYVQGVVLTSHSVG